MCLYLPKAGSFVSRLSILIVIVYCLLVHRLLILIYKNLQHNTYLSYSINISVDYRKQQVPSNEQVMNYAFQFWWKVRIVEKNIESLCSNCTMPYTTKCIFVQTELKTNTVFR